jgi:arogenate dehydrogenase (NADP+), plant
MASSLRHFAGLGSTAGPAAATSSCFLCRYIPDFCAFAALRPTRSVAVVTAAAKPRFPTERPPQHEQQEGEEAAPCQDPRHDPPVPPLRVGIVGFGNFGQFIAAGVQRQGHAVLAASRSDYSAYCTQHGIRFFR